MAEGEITRFAEVERRKDVDPKEFHRLYARPNRPVVLTTGGRFWRDPQPLTPERFRDWYRDKPLSSLVHGRGGDHGITERHVREMVTVGGYFDRVLEDAANPIEASPAPPRDRSAFGAMYGVMRAKENARGLPYLTNLELTNFPEIATRFQTLPDFGRNWLEIFNSSRQIAQGEMFIGASSTAYGELHFDTTAMYVATYQLYGKKKWWLYPPENSKYLYPMPYPGGWYPHFSPVDQENPDLERFPDFAHARGYSTTLEAGDVLFCPAHWWHNTRNLTISISVAVRMAGAKNFPAMVRDHVETILTDAMIARRYRFILRQ